MRHDSDGRRLPIKLDSTSNGEVAPMPLERVHLHANALAHQAADANAKRLGLSPKTVANHLSSIFVKLCVADRAGAILRAREAGIDRSVTRDD